MKLELQNKLFEKYPNIFKNKDLPMNQTCMCWGIECGDGWYDLIDGLCSQLSPTVIADQVKEKYGGLRFYICSGTEADYELIDNTEEKSYHICEQCGSTDNVSQTKGWISTLCANCKEKK